MYPAINARIHIYRKNFIERLPYSPKKEKALKIIDVGEYESGEVKLLFTFKQGGEEVVIREEDK